MNKAWPLVQLGDVLKERREEPSSDDLDSGRVKVIEKISFDTGQIRLRIDGSTKTRMILVKPGDLVVSGINAAKGAIAIYDDSPTEPVAATIHYGAYTPNRDRVDTRFLWWMLRSHIFREVLVEYVPGGIKTELKSKRLLPIPVPLPPLVEQRRVVARIEELVGQIHEARLLRQRCDVETKALAASSLNAAFSSITSGSRCRLDSVAAIIGGGSLPDCALSPEGSAEVLFVKVSDMNRPGNEELLRASAFGVPSDSPLLKGLPD